MELKNILMRPTNLYEALLHKKLVGGGGSETIIATDYTPYLYRSAPSFGQAYNRQRPVVVGGSVGWNQLVDVGVTSVTVPSGHKYYANINGTKTIGSSNGSAIAINDGSADNVIDLTALWGSSVADAIYAMEQSVSGSGVAYFKTLFGEDYYAYNAGSLESVQTSAHVIRDGNNTVIGNYALDSSLILRGVPKWVDGQLKYDGDVYHADGTVDRKYGIVDLGTLNWSRNATSQFFATLSPPAKEAWKTNHICSKYVASAYGAYSSNVDKSISISISMVWIRDSAYDDPTAFKASLDGVYLVYELATPTTESATPYTALQVADPQGTEEWVTSGVVPVGQETEYIQKS